MADDTQPRTRAGIPSGGQWEATQRSDGDANPVDSLVQQVGATVETCATALRESGGDMEAAREWLAKEASMRGLGTRMLAENGKFQEARKNLALFSAQALATRVSMRYPDAEAVLLTTDGGLDMEVFVRGEEEAVPWWDDEALSEDLSDPMFMLRQQTRDLPKLLEPWAAGHCDTGEIRLPIDSLLQGQPADL